MYNIDQYCIYSSNIIYTANNVVNHGNLVKPTAKLQHLICIPLVSGKHVCLFNLVYQLSFLSYVFTCKTSLIPPGFRTSVNIPGHIPLNTEYTASTDWRRKRAQPHPMINPRQRPSDTRSLQLSRIVATQDPLLQLQDALEVFLRHGKGDQKHQTMWWTTWNFDHFWMSLDVAIKIDLTLRSDSRNCNIEKLGCHGL